MSRKMITQEDVFNAAQEIVAQGEQPAVLKVHSLLGRGSFSTITKYLRVWENSYEATEASVNSLPKENEAPEILNVDTQALVKKIWTAAKVIANEQLTTERLALEEVKIKYDRDIEQAINIADQAASKQAALEELLKSANDNFELLETKVIELTAQLKSQTENLIAARSTETELQDSIKHQISKNQVLSEKVSAAEASLTSEQRHTQYLEKQLKDQKNEYSKTLDSANQRHSAELDKSDKRHTAEIQRQTDIMQHQTKHISELKASFEQSAIKLQSQAEVLGELKAKAETSARAQAKIKTLESELVNQKK